MSIGVSKVLMLFEAVLLALPVTVLALWGGAALILYPGANGAPGSALLINLTVVTAVAALLAGWWLLLGFLRLGTYALVSAGLWAWLVAGVGVCLSLAGLVQVLLPEHSDESLASADLRAFVFGIPALVPFAHLLLERVYRREANNALERERGRQLR